MLSCADAECMYSEGQSGQFKQSFDCWARTSRRLQRAASTCAKLTVSPNASSTFCGRTAWAIISGDIHEKLVEVTHVEDDLIACTDKIPSLFLDRAGWHWRAELVKMTSGANNSKVRPAYQLHVTREIGVDGATQACRPANQQPRLICCGTPSWKKLAESQRPSSQCSSLWDDT